MSLTRLLTVAGLLLAPITALADTYYVDGGAAGGGDGSQLTPFQSVQAAIDAASTGDTVQIAAGTYIENLTCNKGITLQGEDAETTILDGDASGSVLTASSFSGTIVLQDLTVTNGSAESGGGILFNSCTAEVRDCHVVGNVCSGGLGSGGAIEGVSTSLTLDNCVVSENTGSSLTAGVYVYSGTLLATNCTLEDNDASAFDVASATSMIVRGCSIRRNSSSYGGAFYVSGVPSYLIADCVLSDNTAYYGSGAVFSESSSGTIENCLVSGNTVTSASSVDFSALRFTGGSGSVAVRHCTVTANTSTQTAAISVNTGSSVTVVSSIVWGNTPSQISSSGTLDVTYSNVEGGQAGTGNINSDPLFVDSAGGDYRLGTGSPCIDAGTTVSDPPTTDFEGDPRSVDGDSDSTATPDMGCDEFDLLVALSGTRETGQTIHFDAMAPPAFEDHFVQVFFSLTSGSVSGGLTVPNSGGQKLMLDVDALFNEMLALSAYFRVQLDASGTGATSDVVIPAGAPTGVSLYFAGLSWDLGSPGTFDFTPTQEIVLQ
ncbi:MAG: right-handed parallel beta-helix repeat-containing protein [Planctomycetota bacterium]